MLDTEFRGGVALTISTTPIDADEDGAPDVDDQGQILRRLVLHTGDSGVEARIRGLGDRAAEVAGGDENVERVLRQFGKAQVLTVGRTERTEDGGVLAGEFQIKVAAPEGMEEDATITDTVVKAIVDELGDVIDLNPAVTFDGADTADPTPFARPITQERLSQAIDRPEVTQVVTPFVGGVAILAENLEPAITEAEVRRRLQRMREQPEFREYAGRRVDVVPLAAVDPRNPGAGLRSAVILVHDPVLSYVRPDVEPVAWRIGLADPEWRLVVTALGQPQSLDEVNSYSSSVAQTLKANATVAVALSLLGILIYIWVRFGSLRYSMAAIAALVHDVVISLGLLALSGVLGVTSFGSALLIEPFRIDLGVVAALLTIIGYSLNDTIVILDRIRENRGKHPVAGRATVNLSINQTVSRTLLTSVTTLMAVLIMYAEGGSGIRPFTFCLLAGLIVGTYSSVAIAAPLVYVKGQGDERMSPARDTGSRPIEGGESSSSLAKA
jgi:SecD/SecF fusion protein